MSPMYHKLRIAKLKERSRKGHEAKAKKRMADSSLGWTNHRHVFEYSVSPCGRYIGLTIDGKWTRCGTERYLRGILAKMIWKKTNKENRNDRRSQDRDL